VGIGRAAPDGDPSAGEVGKVAGEVWPDDAADGAHVPEQFDEGVPADGDVAGGASGDHDAEAGDRSILEDDDVHGRALSSASGSTVPRLAKPCAAA
jgi:hypothetical protein